jgi:hypothetical protein
VLADPKANFPMLRGPELALGAALAAFALAAC